MKRSAVKQLTIRVPQTLLQRARTIAKKHGRSLNDLAVQGLDELARQEAQEELRRAYDALGAAGDNDVQAALPAQAEVLDNE